MAGAVLLCTIAALGTSCGPSDAPQAGDRPAARRAPFDPKDPAASGMVVTFEDEFDTVSYSPGAPSVSRHRPKEKLKWVDHAWYNEERPAPGVFTVHDGKLDITAFRDDSGWHSGHLQSTDGSGAGFAQKYGYFEIVAKIAKGQGLVSTFYLMSQDHVERGEEPAAEIDILETPGNGVTDSYTTLHRDSDESHKANIQSKHNRTRTGIDLSQDFHRYGMLWSPESDHLKFYLDGKHLMDVKKFDTTDRSAAMMTVAVVVGTWAGKPDHTTPNPARMVVDSVRVWQFRDQLPESAQR
jgi:hypothetical protein